VDYELESGRCAYEAYRHALQARSGAQDQLPEWDDLPTGDRENWIAVATALREHERERASQL
jgi:hypothetical protein